MRIVRTFDKARIGALVFSLLFAGAVLAAQATPEVLEPTERHAKISRLVTTLLERSHYRRSAIDDEVSTQIFDSYLEALDGNRLYFYASDIAELEPMRTSLDEAVKHGRLDLPFEVYRRYIQRMRERMEHALSLLNEQPDFTVDERFLFDRSNEPWPATKGQLDEIWRKRVKNDVLGLMLTDKDWEESREILTKRYQQVLRRMDQIKSDDAFEVFMNAYARTLDPHTSYFSPRNSEEYRIQMSLNYDGIGASLQVQDEYVTVLSIIEGGPASVDGSLKPNDRIIGVGQGDKGELVDVVGWRLDEVVDLIRGPGGTAVRLQVLPAGAVPGSGEKILTLVRDKVKLEAQAAKKKLIEIKRGGDVRRIGVIEVPSFYQDYNARASGSRDYISTTADVRRLTQELESEGIDGLVIDLRNNGGGHLSEATAMTGLFIDRGPVVQLRDTSGRVEVLDDPLPEVVYDGPLAVLVNRFSASASEIFAAAIQDYGRGVVLGQQTYGKGTVQNLYPLDRYAPGPNPRFGQLTLTIGKYYRVTGESTQHRGVVPDIALPSAVDAELIGESTQSYALPWDQIKATGFTPAQSLQGAIEVLADTHERRATLDADFDYLRNDIEAHEALRQQEWISLNLETRRKENAAFEAQRLARENGRRAAHGLEPLASLEELETTDAGNEIILREAAEIMTDFVQSNKAALASARSRESS